VLRRFPGPLLKGMEHIDRFPKLGHVTDRGVPPWYEF
jgi:hypothetical protein